MDANANKVTAKPPKKTQNLNAKVFFFFSGCTYSHFFCFAICLGTPKRERRKLRFRDIFLEIRFPSTSHESAFLHTPDSASQMASASNTKNQVKRTVILQQFGRETERDLLLFLLDHLLKEAVGAAQLFLNHFLKAHLT